MSYCVPLGLPHSQFLSWSDDDQDKALAWTLDSRDRCHGCGTRADEWEPDKGGSRNAYEAKLHICPGCERRSWAREEEGVGSRPGVYVRLVKPNP